MMKYKRGFASDNNSGVHPEIMKAIEAANKDHAISYGADKYTESAIKKFKGHFGEKMEVFFVFGGTGANVLGLLAVTKPFNSIICADTAHINTDECGAPEMATGCKLMPIPSPDGRITVEQIATRLRGAGDQHHSQERVVSITQSTEMGTVYTPDEMKEIARFCHKNNLYLHVDGARLFNAAATLGIPFKKITSDAGIDILSFGGTKNGMMYGEAVVFFDPDLARDFKFIRKQGTHLPSKMRFISAQFDALLSNNLWFRLADYSNRMALLLAERLKNIPEVKITKPVQANAVFVTIPPKYIPKLQKEYFFYIFNPAIHECRLMCTWDTTEEDIENFTALMKKMVR